MGIRRMVRALRLALAIGWLAAGGVGVAAAAAAGDLAWPDGETLISALPASEPPLVPPAPVEPAVTQIVGGFTAAPVRLPALGEPDGIMDRMLAEAIDRGHWRAAPHQVEYPEREWVTEADIDTLWDDLIAMSAEDRFRRLRPIVDFLRETTPGEFTIPVEQLPANSVAASAAQDGWIVRTMKNLMKANERSHLITRERVVLALVVIAALSGLYRLAIRS